MEIVPFIRKKIRVIIYASRGDLATWPRHLRSFAQWQCPQLRSVLYCRLAIVSKIPRVLPKDGAPVRLTPASILLRVFYILRHSLR